jgi:CHAD domain-containing protein
VRSFHLGDGVDAAGALRALGEHLALAEQPPRREKVTVLDTFDGRLHAAGLQAEHDGTALRAGGAAADLPPARALLVRDLPEGPLRDLLAPVMKERALLPRATIRRTISPAGILNADEKTVVRAEVSEQAVEGAGSLPARLTLRPVRGYDKEFERACSTVAKRLQLAVAEDSATDAALRAAGVDPAGISSKIDFHPAPGVRSDVAANFVLAKMADVAEANLQGTLDDLDIEFLHDLRVSVRRARSVLREMAGVHDPDARASLREELKWVQQVTGPTRDLDVQLDEWDDLVAPLATPNRADLVPLRELLERHRADALEEMRAALRSERFSASLAEWRAFAALPPARKGDRKARPRAALPIQAVAGDRIRVVHQRMLRDGGRIDDSCPDEALHDLRKRGKELRYLLELFGGLYPADVVKPMVSALKRLQDVLGRFQDRAVQVEKLRALARDLATQERGPDALLAMGLVIDALDRDQHAARAEFAERFAAFSAKEQRKLVEKTFPLLEGR